MSPEDAAHLLQTIAHNAEVTARHAEAQTKLLQNMQQIVRGLYWVGGLAAVIMVLIVAGFFMRH